MDISEWIGLWWSKGSISSQEAAQWEVESQLEGFVESLSACYQNQTGSTEQPLYDLLITQHLGRTAICETDCEGVTKKWSYDELNAKALCLCERWARLEVEAGQRLAIYAPLGRHFAVLLAAGLRLGLHVGFFPSQTCFTSKAGEKKKLIDFSPDWIADLSGEMHIGEIPHLPTEFSSESAVVGEAYDYGQEEMLYGEVSFGKWWRSALCDGLVAMGLHPGMTWSRPLCSPLRYEPYATLLAWLFGLTTHYLSEETPDFGKELSADILLLDPMLVRLFNAQLPWQKKPKLILRDPLAGGIDCWPSLIDSGALKAVALVDWICVSDWGGGVLASRRKLKESEWMLPTVELVFSDSFSLVPGKQLTLGEIQTPICLDPLFNQMRRQWMVTASTELIISGQWYKIDTIENSLKSLPGCVGACLVSKPRFGDPIDKEFIAVLFVEEGFAFEEISVKAREKIQNEIAPLLKSQRVTCSSQLPRYIEGCIDRHWVTDQCARGLLEKKEKSSLFQAIRNLRYALSAQEG